MIMDFSRTLVTCIEDVKMSDETSTEENAYDRCGACGGRRDEHIPAIGNTLFAPTCIEYRPTNEKGEWVWVPERALHALEIRKVYATQQERAESVLAAIWVAATIEAE